MSEVEARRTKVLFLVEAVTLAHVARSIMLFRSLSSKFFEVAFACDPRFDHLFSELPAQRVSLTTMPTKAFLNKLAAGSVLYSAVDLKEQVQEDLNLIEKIAPDVIVGDFRISLSVSARVARVPYVNVTNAYWSPYASGDFPVPDIPFSQFFDLIPCAVRNAVVKPLVYALHAAPLNRVRAKFGLPALKYDLRHAYTDGDYVVYADIPEILPTYSRPANHSYIGAVDWSPSTSLPDWWDHLPDCPKVFVTLGSSGAVDMLPMIIEALSTLPIVVLVATADRMTVSNPPSNVHVSSYLPGMEASKRASLVICNGGSPSTYQALGVGTPVLGFPTNLDQILNMTAVERTGAGMMLRRRGSTVETIRDAVELLLQSSSSRNAAASISRSCKLIDYSRMFPDIIRAAAVAQAAGR